MKVWIKWILSAVLLGSIGIFVGWRLLAGNIKMPVHTALVRYQTITKDVAFTAGVKAQHSSSIAFELTGSIQAVYANVGDSVVKGQKLALLNPESVALELTKAKADKAGTSSVEYLTWQKAIDDIKNTKAENTKMLEQKRQVVRDAKTSLDQSKDVYNAKSGESGESASATKSTYSTVVANQAVYTLAQKTLDTAITSAQKMNVAAQKTADIAYAQYIGNTSSFGALEQLASIKATKSILRAPFDGVVTKRSAEIGEFATAGEELFTVETISRVELTADVPETDVLVLISGMSAEVTFDALQLQPAIATTVQSIDPAAVVIQGVPTFRVTLPLINAPTSLRPGITANVIVHVATKEHVLGIPRRALITKNGKEFVKIQKTDNSEEERYVTTGLAGSDGTIEITSGLADGDIVVTP